MSKLFLRTGISVATVVALSFALAPAALASPQETAVNTPIAYGTSAVSLAQIPDSNSQNPVTAVTAVDQTTENLIIQRPDQSATLSRHSRSETLGCVGSLTVALAAVSLPAVTHLQIKKLAKQLRGVKQAVDLLVSPNVTSEKVQAAGGVLASLVGERIGIKAIKENCFV